MERTDEKRRHSILKKRRSRSLSPKSPKERATRRASRRISFSGKHNVREFFTNESTAIAWGETYDVSAEKHVLSNEQITLQSTRLSSMSVTSQTTRNDTVAMDISNMANNHKIPDVTKNVPAQEKSVNFTSIPKQRVKAIPADEKENIAILDDLDFSLELPPPAPSTKSFSLSKCIPSIFSSSLRPTLFDFATKTSMVESSACAEKTSGSDNMDISGIEPTEQNKVNVGAGTITRESEYTNWLKGENFLSKNQPKPVNKIMDIQLDDTPILELPTERQRIEINSQKTIDQPLEMSLEAKKQTLCQNVSGSFADMSLEAEPAKIDRQKTVNTTVNIIDKKMSHLKPSSANQGDSLEETFEQPINRQTVNLPHDITTDNLNASKAHLLSANEVSVQYIPGQYKQPSYRQTLHQTDDMETSSVANHIGKSFKKQINRRTVIEAQDITIDDSNISKANPCNRTTEMSVQLLDTYQRAPQHETLLQVQCMEMASPLMQLSNSPTSQTATSKPFRQTLNKPQDVSLDCSHIQSKSMHRKLDAGTLTSNAAGKNRSSRRQTLLQEQDIELDSPLKQSNKVDTSQHQTRNSITKPLNISVEADDKRPDTIPSLKPDRRQTTHTIKDISMNISMTQCNTPRTDAKQCVRDISLDDIHSIDSPAVQHGNLNWKRGGVSSTVSRQTINEPRDMSFDSNATGKSNTHSRYNKTILGDMSMDMQSTDFYGQSHCKSVFGKSPSKNASNTYDRSSLEFTKVIDQNNISYHPLQSTKLNDNNCSKFTGIVWNRSAEKSSSDDIIREDEPRQTATAAAQVPVLLKHAIRITEPTHSQTINDIYDLDISDDISPLATAKKYNPNKTPYYAGLDLASDTSSLELTANDFNDVNPFEPMKNEQQSNIPEQHHGTKMFHATINDDNSQLNELAQTMELSYTSTAPNLLERPKAKSNNTIPEILKRLSMPNQSLFQLSSIGSPIQIDDSVANGKGPARKSLTNLVNVSIDTNESSKQLTFIEDDDDEEQICNTKIDLASSLENSDNESLIANMAAVVKPLIANTPAILTSIDQSNPSLCDELNAFKRSNRLRHSNVCERNEMANANRSDSITLNDESATIAHNHNTLTDIGQSQIMQRRSNNASASDEANETSFLKKRPDKEASEVKLDFSGYDELEGLATPMDVFGDFLERMEKIRRQDEIWTEQYRKFEAGEIDNFDDNNNDDLTSQNVEAPSWTHLFKNKLQEELEEHKREWEREWNERLPGAFLPAIPCINLLMMEKCRQLNHWYFNDVWYFVGNIHLCSKEMIAFKVCLVYDPAEVERHSEVYGAIQFDHIEYEFCKEQLTVRRENPIFLLEVRELTSKLPRDMTPMCKSSANLSEFDEKLHEYCVRARNKVKHLKAIWRKYKALIKEENGTIFILKTMFDFKSYDCQEFIIKLDDIDTTDWRNVLTNPRRILNEDIKSLPKGVAFIEELLANCSKYVPWK